MLPLELPQIAGRGEATTQDEPFLVFRLRSSFPQRGREASTFFFLSVIVWRRVPLYRGEGHTVLRGNPFIIQGNRVGGLVKPILSFKLLFTAVQCVCGRVTRWSGQLPQYLGQRGLFLYTRSF